MIQDVIVICFKLLGALALFMFGMQLGSNGIQRAAGDRLQGTVNFMTKNRFFAVITGVLVTILLQSSSATTVMVVSFVNAGLLNLFQAIGVIMGANIGTTLTGWIIAAVGVQKFSIALVAIPLFGVGFFMSLAKRRGESFVSYGEGIMGFALIFLGLDYLAKAIPDPSGDALLFLQDFSGKGWLTVIVCVLAGTVFTMLINASSATLAIVIGLSAKGIINFEMAAALTLGANIGTTFDSFLVSLGTNTNGKRAAWAHIIFNIVGTVWVVAALKPFIEFVDFITPGAITVETAGTHIAMMHTLFNTANTLVLLPFVRQYAAALCRLIKPKHGEDELSSLVYRPLPLLEAPELNIAKARSDITRLAEASDGVFTRFASEMKACNWDVETLEWFTRYSEYALSVKQGISRFLLEVAQQDIADKTRENLGNLMQLVDDFENICHTTLTMANMEHKCVLKKLSFSDSETELLDPYTSLVRELLGFVKTRLDRPLSAEDLAVAADLENRIDANRSELKKIARKRIKAGADVKVELQFIDLIRHIEKIGNNAYSVAVTLKAMR